MERRTNEVKSKGFQFRTTESKKLRVIHKNVKNKPSSKIKNKS